MVEQDAKVELHAIIHGKVQGVGFRATVAHYASKLGLTGTVRNMMDGSVEIYAQGKKADLEKLLDLLKTQGAGLIDSISENYNDLSKQYNKFQIIH